MSMSRERALKPLMLEGAPSALLAGDRRARARVRGPVELLVAELFASAAGCDCDCAPGSGSSTTVEVLLLPVSRTRDVVDGARVEEAASAGLSHDATLVRNTGLWMTGVVVP